MSPSRISVNEKALKLVEELYDDPEKFGVILKESKSSAKIIDAGINAKGGLLAGRIITEISLGGLGEAYLSHKDYGGFKFPCISVFTDHPAIATLGSQLAGWHIKVEGYSAIGSGPARALALKPKSIYREIDYRDEADNAVLLLETSKEPPESVITYISNCCGVEPNRLYLILVPTSSVAGFTQVSGRVVETGIHKLAMLGLDPCMITHAHGYAPIMPVHLDLIEAMGRTNDAIIYGGVTSYIVEYEGEEFGDLVKKAVSSASKQYGRPFAEIFKEANLDFYEVDSKLFAPAVMEINNAKTGETFRSGRVDVAVLRRSMEA